MIDMGRYDEELARRADAAGLTAHSAAAVGLQVPCCEQCDEDGCCPAGCLPRVEYGPASALWIIERELSAVSPEVAEAMRELMALDTREGRRRAGRAFAPTGKHIRVMPDTDARDEDAAALVKRADAYIGLRMDTGVTARAALRHFCEAEALRMERTNAGRERARKAVYARLRHALMKEGRWHYRRPKTYTP